ncbi:MAG: DNA repair protein RecO [Sedimentisphaerales bacterium]|nr:DNA repair protein RecO [Sedimentisphaerales bacterium]
MLTKDTAICIRTTDYSETSQIVTLFTRTTGKIGAIAKGSKRPKSAFDGPLEVLSCGQIVFSDSNREKLATLTEFQQNPAFSCKADNLFSLNCCLFAAELVNALTHDYDPHPELFDSFLQFLQNANSHRASGIEHREMLSLLILFQLTLLREIGLMPVLNACANCKTSHGSPVTSNEFYFSSSANGLICTDCEASFPDKIKLTRNAADCLADAKLIPDAKEKTLDEIQQVLTKHLTEILHRPPKMAKYVLKN